MISPQPKVSVVIPTHNRADAACACVDSILANGYPNLEVIVVDDHSSDETQTKVSERFRNDPRVTCIRNAVNLMPAGTRNVGGANATGDYIFFIDDDNELYPNCLANMVADFTCTPDAGIIAPMIVRQTGDGRLRTMATFCDFNRWTGRPADQGIWTDVSELTDAPLPTHQYGNGYMVTREAFRRCHGFDESLSFVFEECDFCWRARELGYGCYISTRARTNHLYMVGSEDNHALRMYRFETHNRAYNLGRNRYIFAKRHYNFFQVAFQILVMTPLFVAFYTRLALKNRRPDLAWSYIRGTLRGVFLPAPSPFGSVDRPPTK